MRAYMAEGYEVDSVSAWRLGGRRIPRSGQERRPVKAWLRRGSSTMRRIWRRFRRCSSGSARPVGFGVKFTHVATSICGPRSPCSSPSGWSRIGVFFVEDTCRRAGGLVPSDPRAVHEPQAMGEQFVHP